MNNDDTKRGLARGEARSKIHWGAGVDEVFELLRANYGIESDEADAMVADAVAARRSAIREKASIALGFAAIGLAASATYFFVQRSVGFVVIGFGPILMISLGLISLATAARSIHRIVTGDASGPV